MMWLLVALSLACPAVPGVTRVEVTGPDRVVGDLPVTLTIKAQSALGTVLPVDCGQATLSGVFDEHGDAIEQAPAFIKGVASVEGVIGDSGVEVAFDYFEPGGTETPTKLTARYAPSHIPGWATVLPPLVAVFVAIFLRQAIIALLAGIWLGALFLHELNPLTAILRTFDTYLLDNLADRDHAAILMFTLALGGMVGVLQRSGATLSLVGAIAKRATTRRSGLLTAWAAGLAIFFDDYANCLLVGNTVRPFTDKLRISREKLAYIVDSTAAPVATVALISTWIGFQIGEFETAFEGIAEVNGYQLFLNVLPYSFYSFLTISFVFMLAYTVRDFGPMLRAERRAYWDGDLFRKGAQPLMDPELTRELASDAKAPWPVAVIPIVGVVLIVMVGLYVSGSAAAGPGAGLRTIISSANPYAVLIWASFGGGALAMAAVLFGRHLTVPTALDAWLGGAKAMLIALLILVLAWTIGDICKAHLHTGDWLLSKLSPNPAFLPTYTFIIAGAIALATGSSYSTMSIMIPIAGPMAWALTGETSGIDPATVESIRHATLAAILGGAVFGDHCSPISDTTIMSSMSSGSDHVDHVRTQLPYALVCAGAAILIGFLPAGYGVRPIITLPIGVAALLAVVLVVGKKLEQQPAPGPAPKDS